VRDLLGHADLTTTLRYAHLAPDHQAQAVALLNKA
jgi:site-specific recombinase XerD